MRKIIILFVLIALSNLTGKAQDEGANIIDYKVSNTYEIGGITVSGVQFLDEQILIKLSGLRVGQSIEVPGDKISNAVKALWKQGLFGDVQIYITKTVGDKIFLNINLEEKARLSSFRFRGVRKTEADDLKDDINLVKGKVVTDNLKITAEYKITNYFREKGFLNTKVDIYEKPDTTQKNSIVLIIDVKKGKKIRIDNITFIGNENIARARLKSSMKETKDKGRFHPIKKGDLKKFFSFKNPIFHPGKVLGSVSPTKAYHTFDDRFRFRIFSSSKYDQAGFEKDQQAIIDLYNTKGYRDARIVTSKVLENDNGDLNISLEIEEGTQYYFRHITFKGNTKYSSQKLSDVLNIKVGEIYDASLLEMRLHMSPDGNDISALYMDDGYLFFQVTPIEVSIENDSIDIEVRVYEGPQATINKITILGNTKTNERVIRREIRTLPGAKFSRSDIIRSQREIANLGFFDAEKIQINPQPHPEDGTVDIEYRVEERPSDQVELSAGWGGPTGIIGTLGVSFNNFSTRNMFKKNSWSPLPAGDGQILSLRAQANPYFTSFSSSFTEPWLGGKKPNSFSVSVFESTQTNGITKKQERDDPAILRRALRTIGAKVGLGTRLKWPDDFFVLQSSLNYENYKLMDWSGFGFQCTDCEANNFYLEETISRNSLDQMFYPRRGSNISLGIQLTPPYSMFRDKSFYDTRTIASQYQLLEYHKWKFKAEFYTPLVGDLVLKATAKFGFLGYYNKITGLAPFERYEVGGDGLSNFALYGKDIIALRGYDPIHIMPTEVAEQGAPIFGKYNLELRFPLVLKPMSTIYTLAFLEGGNAWASFNDFDPFNVKRSAGVGLRMYLPMFGLLGFDYGIGFDKVTAPTTGVGSYLGARGKLSIILGFEPE